MQLDALPDLEVRLVLGLWLHTSTTVSDLQRLPPREWPSRLIPSLGRMDQFPSYFADAITYHGHIIERLQDRDDAERAEALWWSVVAGARQRQRGARGVTAGDRAAPDPREGAGGLP